ncbi:MAG: hypothetical protein KZQ83_19690 [gamma proteobacterium symbiont of Taylorina sp.]|nr:hypothetical protein [gamma proteobacterium symbiont of Taylorina sp.]
MRTKITISIIIAAIIFIVDAFFLNQGVIAGITLFIIIFVLIPKTIYRQYKKKEYKMGYIICLIYGTSAGLVFCANYVNNLIAYHRSEILITKIEKYKKDNGSYPKKLEALIPKYIESIPSAKYASMSRFHYSNSQEFTSLYYVTMPPFGRHSYDFSEKKWDHYD